MANHYVSPSGSATWAASTSIDTPTSIATANANAVAGDTVYLRGGTYYYYIRPANSGTGISNRVIFQAYPGETPTFTVDEAGGRWAIFLQGRSWVKISGISSYHCGAFFRIGYGSSYNEISYSNFSEDTHADYQQGYITWLSSAGAEGPGSDHNWIHHNIFEKYGWISACDDKGTIRISANYNDPSRNNTFEDNVFANGGHDCMDVGGQYNVIRRNVFHNEQSYFVDPGGCVNSSSNGYFGNRCLLLSNSGEYPGTANHTLIEGNRIGHSGMSPDDNGAHCIENAGCHSLIRFNDLYNAAGSGLYFKTQPVPSPGVTLKSGSWSRVYNNTIYHSGYGDEDIGDGFKDGILAIGIATSDYWPWPEDVIIKNNIVYDYHTAEYDWPDAPREYSITYENNWNTAAGDPLFVDDDISNPTSLVLPNLELTASSPCIRAGTHLTLANGAGTASTTLGVDDAYPFQDGSWGSLLTHGVTHFPDWIAIGSVTNVVEIEAVNYGTRVITLATPMTWADNAPIWLYKNSSGVRVLYGSAPEIGAHAYAGAGLIDTPLVVAAAAHAHASSVPTLSLGADHTLIVSGAAHALEADALSIVTPVPSPWAISLGPIGYELTLPPPNWRAGSRPRLRVERRVHITRVDLDDGSVRHHYRTNAPRSWTFEWARLSAADVLGIRNLAALNEPLHFQNRIESTDWTWVVIEEFVPVPIAATFASGTPRYRATLVVREAL